MAAAVRCMGRALIHHQRHSLSKMVYQTSVCSCSVNIQVPNRHFAAATKSAKKTKNVAKEKTPDEKKDEIEKIKAYPYMEGEPEDDVYLKRLYPRQIYDVEKAVHLLKKFQVLDFTGPKQSVYLDLTLDMTQGRKKNVAPFTSVLSLPYPFASEINKVAVFTENASEVKIAEENGAAFAGGTSLIQKIWDDEIVVDFYVAVPEIMPELNRLRKKLGKRFPRVSRNSIGRDIPKMLEFFKNGHEIKVDEERESGVTLELERQKRHCDFDTAVPPHVTRDMRILQSGLCREQGQPRLRGRGWGHGGPVASPLSRPAGSWQHAPCSAGSRHLHCPSAESTGEASSESVGTF